jgi:hypothetical protein
MRIRPRLSSRAGVRGKERVRTGCSQILAQHPQLSSEQVPSELDAFESNETHAANNDNVE